MQLYKFTNNDSIYATDCNVTLIYKNFNDLQFIDEDLREGNVFLEIIYQYDSREEYCQGPKFLMKEKDFDVALQRMTGSDPIVDLTDLVIAEYGFNTNFKRQKRFTV